MIVKTPRLFALTSLSTYGLLHFLSREVRKTFCKRLLIEKITKSMKNKLLDETRSLSSVPARFKIHFRVPGNRDDFPFP